MLENFTFTGRELLLAVVLASVVYLFEVLLFSRRNKTRAPASVATHSVETRLAALAAELAELKLRLQGLEDRPPVGSTLDVRTTTYADAQRMARAGAPAQELAESLGISRSEAELIIALQRAESGSS